MTFSEPSRLLGPLCALLSSARVGGRIVGMLTGKPVASVRWEVNLTRGRHLPPRSSLLQRFRLLAAAAFGAFAQNTWAGFRCRVISGSYGLGDR